MDPAAIMNDASFPPNTAPFHLPETWQLPPPPLADSEEEESAKGVSTSNNNGGANGVSDGGDGKRMKGSVNRNESGKGETEAGSGKPAEQQTTQPPPEYIHVRARRGQATNSHILAERAIREKISERMKILQDLVPGCNKVTGKALMLDEIINYVLSLQRQVELLQMKLVAENSRLTPGIEVFPPKDEKKRYCRFLKWLDVADANYDLSTEMEQGRLSALKIKVDKDFAGVNKEIRCLKLGVGLIGFVMLFVFLLVCVLK